MSYSAHLQFRTTLDQAGRIAGLAGELDITEAHVLRLLLDDALNVSSDALLERLRDKLEDQLEVDAARLAQYEAGFRGRRT